MTKSKHMCGIFYDNDWGKKMRDTMTTAKHATDATISSRVISYLDSIVDLKTARQIAAKIGEKLESVRVTLNRLSTKNVICRCNSTASACEHYDYHLPCSKADCCARLQKETVKSKVIAFLSKCSEPASAMKIATTTGLKISSVSPTLDKLLKKSRVSRAKGVGVRGGYGWQLMNRCRRDASSTANPSSIDQLIMSVKHIADELICNVV